MSAYNQKVMKKNGDNIQLMAIVLGINEKKSQNLTDSL